MIADDEYEIRHGLSEYVPWEEIGFEVVSIASNGEEALQLITENPVDVLLCDIRMPIMTGIDVARELYQNKENTIIVFLSGYEDFSYAQKAIEYGVRKYILKPTKFDELLEIFKQLKVELDQKDVVLLYEEQKQLEMQSDLSDVQDIAIIKIKDYVTQNYTEANLDDAAKIVYMNPDYVSKYFKQKTGENFSDYVFEIKMKEAAKLLQQVKYKIYQVGEMVGYGNSKNFTRAFRRYYNITPTVYRRQVKWKK